MKHSRCPFLVTVCPVGLVRFPKTSPHAVSNAASAAGSLAAPTGEKKFGYDA